MDPKTKGKSKPKKKRPYKPRNNSRDKESNIDDRSFQKHNSDELRSNDPSWYIYDRTMFDGVISMPTLDFKGIEANWPNPNGDWASIMGADTSNEKIKAPTAVGYYMNPSAGTDLQNDETSAINIAARTLFADLSSNNAKTTQYTPEDVTMLTLALGQIIAITHFLKRAYGITNYFNFYNRIIPNALMGIHKMSATGIENWVKDMPEFRARVNKLIAQVNTIQFPSNLDYFNKCAYIYNNVFVDRDDKMPTYQLMMPYSTWIVDEASYDQGTILQTLLVCDDSNTQYNSPCDLTLILEAMISRVLSSATYNLIYSDVLNAAKKNMIHGEFIHVDPITPDYVIEPLYSEQFNWQVMNMSVLNKPNGTNLTDTGTPSNDVYPNINSLSVRYKPVWNINGGNENEFKFLCAIRKNLPVRIPDIDISNDEFVELLAYYNFPTFVKVNGTTGNARYDGLSDYYCVRMGLTYGATAFPVYINKHFVEEGLGENKTIPFLLNVIHTPLMGFRPTASTKLYIESKLGPYMFPDGRSIRNLRYQAFLGLFSFKTK